MEKQTKINLKALGKSILFTTPLVGDIPMHRFFNKRRIKNLERRTELEKTKTEFKKAKSIDIFFPQ